MPLINLFVSNIGLLLVIFSAHQFFKGDPETSEKRLAILFAVGVLMMLVTGGPLLLGPYVDWSTGAPVVVGH